MTSPAAIALLTCLLAASPALAARTAALDVESAAPEPSAASALAREDLVDLIGFRVREKAVVPPPPELLRRDRHNAGEPARADDAAN